MGGDKIKDFVVNRGESTRTIARRLEKQGLIRNKIVFLVYLRLSDQTGQLQAGSFKLSPNKSVPDLVEELKHGRVDIWITFIEGQRREEYAQLLDEKFDLPQEEFLRLTRGKEGQLFPDSYLLPTDVIVPQVVKQLTDNFEKKWQMVDNQTELSQNQVLILASLIEREVKTDQARPIVAGILIKRLRNDWPLQVDASVQYGKANVTCNKQHEVCNWWPKVTKRDLKTIDSLYNTYIYKGLPPRPICNPSLDSIKAVVNYQPTDYWYYLSDKQGRMRYAKTVEEHNRNISKYLE